MPVAHTLTKAERLSLQRELDLLFNREKPAESFMAYPLRVVFVEQKPASGASVAILASAPKKKFKHAVDRNRLKRLIREACRLHKAALCAAMQQKDSGVLVGFLYVGDTLCTYDTMEAAMRKALNTLIHKMI